MTVLELITLLNQCDQAAPVVVFIHGKDEPITSVEFGGQDPVVLYYGEREQ